MSKVSQENLKKEKILKLIKDLQYSFYSDENNWNTDFTVANGIKYAKDNNLDEYYELFDITTYEDKQFCVLNTKNTNNVIFSNIDKMMIDTYRMEIINMNKGNIIDVDKMSENTFNSTFSNLKYVKTLFTDTNHKIIDTVYGRWYYGSYIVSNSQGFSPFNNTIIRLAKNVLWKEYKRLLRDYPTKSFEFLLVQKENKKYSLILTGVVDIVTQVRYTNSLLRHIASIYKIPTLPLFDDNLETQNIYFDHLGKRYKTSNKECINLLKSLKKF